MSPGPILNLILEQIIEVDKESFREKIQKEEKALEKTYRKKNQLTRDQIIEKRKEYIGQIDLDYEERILGPEEGNEEEEVEEKPKDGKEEYQKFLDKLK